MALTKLFVASLHPVALKFLVKLLFSLGGVLAEALLVAMFVLITVLVEWLLLVFLLENFASLFTKLLQIDLLSIASLLHAFRTSLLVFLEASVRFEGPTKLPLKIEFTCALHVSLVRQLDARNPHFRGFRLFRLYHGPHLFRLCHLCRYQNPFLHGLVYHDDCLSPLLPSPFL